MTTMTRDEAKTEYAKQLEMSGFWGWRAQHAATPELAAEFSVRSRKCWEASRAAWKIANPESAEYVERWTKIEASRRAECA